MKMLISQISIFLRRGLKQINIWAVMVGVGFLGLVILPTGSIYNWDGVSYISAGLSLTREGRLLDLTGEPYVHWPPGMPILFSIGFMMGMPIDVYSHALSAVLLAAVVGLTYSIFVQLGIPKSFALVGGLLVIQLPSLTVASAFIYSELAFLALFSAALGCFLSYCHTQSNRAFWGLVLASAGMTLFRYAGLFFVALISFHLMTQVQKKSWKHQLAVAGKYLSLSLLPSALWLARNLLVVGAVTDRVFILHAPDVTFWIKAMHNLAASVVYINGRFALLLIIIVLLVVLLLILWRYYRTRSDLRGLEGIFVQSAFLYLIFLLTIHIAFDRATQFGLRQLLPYAYLVFLAIYSSWFSPILQARPGSKRFKMLIGALIGIHLFTGWAVMMLGFRQAAVRQHAGIASVGRAINAFTDHTPIHVQYSNLPDFLFAATHHSSRPLPIKFYIDTGQQNPHYEKDIREMMSEMVKGGAVILFDHGYGYMMSGDEARTLPGIVRAFENSGITIYLAN